MTDGLIYAKAVCTLRRAFPWVVGGYDVPTNSSPWTRLVLPLASMAAAVT